MPSSVNLSQQNQVWRHFKYEGLSSSQKQQKGSLRYTVSSSCAVARSLCRPAVQRLHPLS
eukprot:53650-Eustigmatos_ZCMA.PRE.1